MHRQPLRHLLRQHRPADDAERQMLAHTLTFIEAYPTCFARTLTSGQPGHITGSAWIVSPDRQQVVLIHHRKLDRWLQPGGHADGDSDVARVALREAEEETGLRRLQLVTTQDEAQAIFDVDIHRIPARKADPDHLHYDIRFLLEADPGEPFVHSAETTDIRWVNIADIGMYTAEESVLRMVRKIQ